MIMGNRQLRMILASIIGGLIGVLLVKSGMMSPLAIRHNIVTVLLLMLLAGIIAVRAFIRAGKR